MSSRNTTKTTVERINGTIVRPGVDQAQHRLAFCALLRWPGRATLKVISVPGDKRPDADQKAVARSLVRVVHILGEERIRGPWYKGISRNTQRRVLVCRTETREPQPPLLVQTLACEAHLSFCPAEGNIRSFHPFPFRRESSLLVCLVEVESRSTFCRRKTSSGLKGCQRAH